VCIKTSLARRGRGGWIVPLSLDSSVASLLQNDKRGASEPSGGASLSCGSFVSEPASKESLLIAFFPGFMDSWIEAQDMKMGSSTQKVELHTEEMANSKNPQATSKNLKMAAAVCSMF
jgi:hypothetical protein